MIFSIVMLFHGKECIIQDTHLHKRHRVILDHNHDTYHDIIGWLLISIYTSNNKSTKSFLFEQERHTYSTVYINAH